MFMRSKVRTLSRPSCAVARLSLPVAFAFASFLSLCVCASLPRLLGVALFCCRLGSKRSLLLLSVVEDILLILQVLLLPVVEDIFLICRRSRKKGRQGIEVSSTLDFNRSYGSKQFGVAQCVVLQCRAC